MSERGGTMTTLRALLLVVAAIGSFGIAVAKLPPPAPMNDQQKAAADEKKAKDAADAKADTDALTRAQDRVAARYIAEEKAKGVIVVPTPISPPTSNAVTTPQGNTPAGGSTGLPADAKGPSKTK